MKQCSLPVILKGIIREKPHLTILTGRKGSGKTTTLIKMLRDKGGWRGTYDKIVIVSPTFLLQDIWKSISNVGVEVHLQFSAEIVDQIQREQNDNKQRRILLILDDLGEDVIRNKESKPIFHKLIANSRHLNISIVWLAQKNTQIPTYARANADTFINFSALSTREKDALFNEISTMSHKEFNKMFAYATDEQHSFFVASLESGKLKYYKNCSEELFVSHQ